MLTSTRTRPAETLGGTAPHLYVTRSATLAYQKHVGDGSLRFETARRSLTLKLLDAVPDPEHDGAYLLDLYQHRKLYLRAFVVPHGRLLVVTKLETV